MTDGKLYMDKAGYESHLAEIDSIRKKIAGLSASRKANNSIIDRDTWNNTGALDIDREEQILLTTLNNLISDLSRIEIVERQEKTADNDDVIDLNDMVEVELLFNNGKQITQVLHLVSALSQSIPGVTNVTINSPIGKAIYGKRVGDIAYYQVERNNVEVFIKGHTREENPTRA